MTSPPAPRAPPASSWIAAARAATSARAAARIGIAAASVADAGRTSQAPGEHRGRRANIAGAGAPATKTPARTWPVHSSRRRRSTAAPAVYRGAVTSKVADINVLGGALAPCSTRPMTGFFRDGSCSTCKEDRGSHTVCAEMTAEFLEASRRAGNDLSTPMPELGFPGLRPGDRWCVCASRWKEALAAGVAPPVVLASTHARALELIDLDDLVAHAIDTN